MPDMPTPESGEFGKVSKVVLDFLDRNIILPPKTLLVVAIVHGSQPRPGGLFVPIHPVLVECIDEQHVPASVGG